MTALSAEDKKLLELIRANDSTGFDLMVERYSAMLYRHVLRMCGDAGEAEDILQETFMTAQEKIGQFRGDGSLRNWLYKIAGNACLQKRRAQKGRKSRELRIDDVIPFHEDQIDEEPTKTRPNPSDQALINELGGRLEEAIAMIPKTNRQVLILRDIEGMSTRETARKLGITEETAKVRLHRARIFVRSQLKEYFE